MPGSITSRRATSTTHTHPPGPEWGRRRLLTILVAAVVVTILILVGLVRATHLAVTGLGDERSSDAPASGVVIDTAGGDLVRGAAYRDEIAAAPMLSVPEQAMFPTDPAPNGPPGIEIPSAETPGPAQILTGFPRTPQGAIGQLAQIDLAALQAMSLPTAEGVYRSWALPGGIGHERWWITQSVAAFLSSASMGQVIDAGTWVETEPAAALVKGTDGPDWATVCVLFQVTATYRQEAQLAFGHCERMQWTGGRWMIAPGPPPAPAPSTWPGTELAKQAGWRPWLAGPVTQQGASR